MPEFKVFWDIGYGREEETIETDDESEAIDTAYRMAREAFESQASYGICEEE